MTTRFTGLIAAFARRQGYALPPEVIAGIEDAESGPDDRDALARLSTALGWEAPDEIEGRPRPQDFPLLRFSQESGWSIAEQYSGGGSTLRITTPEGGASILHDPQDAFFRPAFPASLQHEKTGSSALAVFRRALAKRRSAFVAAGVATVMANILALVTSLFSMQVYDRVIPRSGFSTLWVLSVGVLFALLIDLLLRATRGLLVEREAAGIDEEVSELFFARAQAVRLDARPPGVGTMAAQLRGMEQVRAFLSSGSLFLMADLPFALFFIVVIALLGGSVALVPLISFPIALGLGLLFARGIRAATDSAQHTTNRKNGLLVEAIDAAETVKANGGDWHVLARWNRLNDLVHRDEDPVKRWQSVAGSIFFTLQQMSYVALVAFGAIQVAEGRMTTGTLIACSIIASRVNGPLLAQLPGFIVQWGYARSSLRALDAILRLPADRPAEATALRPAALGGPLRLERVQFAYPGARGGLDIPALEIRPGERIGLIGAIGSGKSTLLRIMAGLYAPSQGSVTIGGLDMPQVAADVLRGHVGYLPQDYRLINGTLRDNLLLGLGYPGDEAILAAARTTGLAQLIASHPRGLDLPIAEGGRGLSGGQRTLTGLTRLALISPKLWLLDEPTADLDQMTEATVMNALARRLGPDSTLVIATHRIALLSLVQRVIVLAGGRVAMDGPTNEVLNRLRTTGEARVVTPPTVVPVPTGAAA